MIFSIPKSKSFIEQFTFHKLSDIQKHSAGSKSMRHQKSPTRLTIQMNKKGSLNTSHSQSYTVNSSKYSQGAKTQLKYNKSRSKSYDKYLVQNKKKVQKQIILRNLNPQQKRIYQDSQENKNIYYGKKLIDPIHKKFNYFIQNQNNQEKTPFVISDFLLEPCKINSKRLETRPFTSQSFINPDSQFFDQKTSKHAKTTNSSSLARTYQKNWRLVNKNESIGKIKQNFMEFSKQLVTLGSKFQSKQFCVEPWQLDPMSHNLDSIKIH